MIFKTIKDDATKSGEAITFLGKKISDIRKDFKNHNGIINSLFKLENFGLSNEQLNIFNEWNEALKDNCLTQEKQTEILQNADKATQKYFKSLKGAPATLDGLAKATGKVSVGARAAAVGLKAFKLALNSIAFMAIIQLISTLANTIITKFDDIVNAYQNGIDKLKDLSGEIKGLESQQSSLNSELKESQERLYELQQIKMPNLFEQAEIENIKEYNKQLELQIRLLELELELKRQEANKKAQDNFKNSQIDNNPFDDLFEEGHQWWEYALFGAGNLLTGSGLSTLKNSFENLTNWFQGNPWEQQMDYLEKAENSLNNYKNALQSLENYQSILGNFDKYQEYMYFNHRFKEKPQGKECGWVQKSLKQTTISIEDLANALVHGASFKPAVLTGGNKSENWTQQQLFGLDFDDGISIEEAYNKVMSLGITPCFVYTTFSHKEDHHKFRMVFCNDTVITNGFTRDKLQATLMGVIGGIDEVCFNRDRLFFGGKGHIVLYPNYDARINAEAIIEKYWNDDYTRYISNSMPKKKQKTVCKNKKGNDVKINEKNNVINENLNVKAISTLDVTLLQELLELVEVKGGLIKKTSFISPPFTQDADTTANTTDEIKDGEYHFSSEAEVYEYINSIDLHEYLGVPSGKFCCILPTHEDTDPSAHIYVADDGTQLYKCFGCNQARTIISITEQLAHCKRHEAINFIKKVYYIDYKPSEWVENQRQLMVDSALYLDSQEFKETFPQINKLIRTRKTDIQKILLHMTKYISEDMQLDGKPLFFASLPNLMKVCERNSKKVLSQSITLFALLNMLNKVELNCVPEEELKKEKQISAKYGFKKIVNFYQVEEYGFTSLEDSEKIANTLLDNNITLKGLSREYVLRTFGVDLADKVFPQYKFENQKGTSEKSDNLTNAIALKVIKTIEKQGYILEKDINTNGNIGVQWKKSIQEIMDSYGLKKVKANKQLKEQYHIESDGYPNIIVKDTI